MCAGAGWEQGLRGEHKGDGGGGGGGGRGVNLCRWIPGLGEGETRGERVKEGRVAWACSA